MDSLRQLLLVTGRLAGDPENVLDTNLPQFVMMVAKGARFGSTTACARDLVPAFRQLRSGPARKWIEIQHSPSCTEVIEGDGLAGGRGQGQGWHQTTRQMAGRAIVLRYRQVGWQFVKLRHLWHLQLRTRAVTNGVAAASNTAGGS